MTSFDDSYLLVFAECDEDRPAEVAHEECPGRSAGLVCACPCHQEDDDLQSEPQVWEGPVRYPRGGPGVGGERGGDRSGPPKAP
ncbi:hypothetical protein OTB20_41470 [Streptomyces sp. H27-H1]|uniref:hypothetical protein n=1 Tax=Streptomyces sp. H27-H1 TaxID=2996461 RepID=UPI0022711279|nr:hypothetical protein [Streptomyces sp. H27-H1]MCY0932497.1 hypothetical protein [Streptomyces sp. H27-H1]